MAKRNFLIDLIENPVLIENEEFSEALLALFHLMDELNSREDLESLPGSDIKVKHWPPSQLTKEIKNFILLEFLPLE